MTARGDTAHGIPQTPYPHGVVADRSDAAPSRMDDVPQDPHVRNAVASARLEGVELDAADVDILEAAAAGELTTDEARRRIIERHGVTLPAAHRLAQSVRASG